MDTFDKISELLAKKGMTQSDLARATGISTGLISQWKKRSQNPSAEKLTVVAEVLGVSVDYLMGKEKPSAVGEELSGMTLVKFPVIGTIAAGYNCCALEEYTGDYAYFSSEDLTAPADEYFVLRVKGNSMYPKLLEDDLVLVRRKPCVDSGKIAVVIYDGEEATIKKVNYVNGENWLELIPINPEYQPKRIENADLEQCCILGEVVKLQRDL